VRVSVCGEILEKRALLWFSGDDHCTAVSAFHHRFRRVQFQSGLLLDGAVALHALDVEKRLHLSCPKLSRIRARSDGRGGERNNDEIAAKCGHE
jgi:hypothetical protein